MAVLKLLDKDDNENIGKYNKDTEIKIPKPDSVKNFISGILEYIKCLFENILK